MVIMSAEYMRDYRARKQAGKQAGIVYPKQSRQNIETRVESLLSRVEALEEEVRMLKQSADLGVAEALPSPARTVRKAAAKPVPAPPVPIEKQTAGDPTKRLSVHDILTRASSKGGSR